MLMRRKALNGHRKLKKQREGRSADRLHPSQEEGAPVHK